MRRLLSPLFWGILALSSSPWVASSAEESAALSALEAKVENPRIKKDRSGRVVEVAVNGPDFSNEDLALFNEFPHLERLTISHAGYAGEKKTGVDFSGVALLKLHPSLDYFSAGGAVGKAYLAALPALTNISELYIQTTHSVDADWAPIGKMTHLSYLGIRVRNDRMSQMTDAFFQHLLPLNNLESFLLSEMTFTDPAAFVTFVTSRPKLTTLILRRCNLRDEILARIRTAMPELEIEIRK